MSTPTNRTPSPARSREACCSPACSERQGPHHDAQKFSTSTWPRMPPRSSLEPSRVSPASAGTGWRSEAGTMLTLGWTGRTCPVAASGASALPPPPPSAVSATTATTAIRTTPPATRASIRRDIGTSIGTGRTAAARAGVEPGVLPPPAGEPAACRQHRRARRAPAATTADHPERAEVECIEGAGKRGQKRPSVARTCARAFVIPRICPLTCGALRWRSLGSVLRCARECSCPSQSTAGGCKGVAASTDEREPALGLAVAPHHGDLHRDDHLPRGNPLVVAVLRRRDTEVDRQLHPLARDPQDRPLEAGDPGPDRRDLVRGRAGGRRPDDWDLQPAEPEGAAARREQAGGDWWLQVTGGRGSTGESQQAEHAR